MSARKIILCFCCPSLFRDLLSLSKEPLGNAAPLPRNPVILKDTAIHPLQKKLSGAPVILIKVADQVNPGETSDPLLSSPSKSPSDRFDRFEQTEGRFFSHEAIYTGIVSKQVQLNILVTMTVKCNSYKRICVGEISQDIQQDFRKYSRAVRGI